MNLSLRPGRLDDAAICGKICFDAFSTIARQHNFTPDFPNVDTAQGLMTMMLGQPSVYSIIAEINGRVVGSNFLWEPAPSSRPSIAGVGPITIDPTVQNGAIGRRLMDDVLQRARQQKFDGVRLVQAAFHNRSLSLYTKLGFDVQEPLSCIQGPALNLTIPGYSVRPGTERDLESCNELCRQVHGHDRSGETLAAIKRGTATVVEDRTATITGYATMIGFFGHAVTRTNEGLQALIGAAPAITGPGFLLPSRNAQLFRWCLEQGLRVVQPMTLMSLGTYHQPRGACLPSILF